MSKAPNPHVMNTTTAGPIGLTAFGVTTILLNFLNAELIEKPSITLIICYGMFHGGMIQILAGMWEVYRGNIFGGSQRLEAVWAFWYGGGGHTSASEVGRMAPLQLEEKWTNPALEDELLTMNHLTTRHLESHTATIECITLDSDSDSDIHRSACLRGSGYLNSAGVHFLERLLVDQIRCACLRGPGYLNSVKASINVPSWVDQWC
mmetsp:Transcript_57866/g.124504  ORF Transcript_57866/g.124504 Transcript_57866/m.124504 type:complete len:206 (+) Transcript_57866:82-699(+)